MRRLKLNVSITAKLHRRVIELGLEKDDLLFAMPESTRPESHYLPFPEGKADQISKSRHAHRTASRVPLDVGYRNWRSSHLPN